VGLGVKATSLTAIWQALGWDPVMADVLLTGVTSDSRQVEAGNLFIACVGEPQRLRRFIEQAQSKQAAAVAVDATQLQLVAAFNFTVPIVSVPDLISNQGLLAASLLSSPSSQMLMVGVTGTNGKTSISHYVAQAYTNLQQPCGVIGTTGNGFLAALKAGPNTTPDAVTVQVLLEQMRAQGAAACVMEVSSHGLDQDRVTGCNFDIAVLSNLSRDHLDYHGSMEAYAAAKSRLFMWPDLQHVVLNVDDQFGQSLRTQIAPEVQQWTYSTLTDDESVMIRVKSAVYSPHGIGAEIETPLGSMNLDVGLYGEFNLSNLLATVGVLLAADCGLLDIEQSLNKLQPVAGRMEKYTATNGVIVIVDYAHTPDALRAALQATRQHLQSGNLWCVFGCGGDRDQGKRPLMAEIAEGYADHVVVTDDNPRYEDNAIIIEHIKAGFRRPEQAQVVSNRKLAIEHSLGSAQTGDIVLIAGKGHEDYQEIAGQRLHFSDREEVARVLQELAQ